MQSRDSIIRELTVRAYEVGSLLNLIQDDDDREVAQEHYERVLNDELHAGALNRRAAAAMSEGMRLLGDAMVAETVGLKVVR